MGNKNQEAKLIIVCITCGGSLVKVTEKSNVDSEIEKATKAGAKHEDHDVRVPNLDWLLDTEPGTQY